MTAILFLAEENHPPDAAAKQCILENHIPFVAFDCQEQAPGYSTVDLDYEESAFTVAQTMLSRCRKTLFYVRPTLSNAQESKREAGVRRAAAQFPQKQLIVGKMPASYQSTDEADQLLRGFPNASMQNPSLRPAFFKEVETLLLPMMECLEPGDAILSSWATWTRFLRWLRRDVPLITGELANNGEDFSGGDIYARMPNSRRTRDLVSAFARFSRKRAGKPRPFDSMYGTGPVARLAVHPLNSYPAYAANQEGSLWMPR